MIVLDHLMPPVTGLDIAPNLLEQARQRAQSENLKIEFVEGDAEKLPYPAGQFDVVMSMFGAMFAPKPFDEPGKWSGSPNQVVAS